MSLLLLFPVYGQAGTVTRFFLNPPILSYSDDAPWSGGPSRSVILSALTSQKLYGQGGQVPPFRWNATLDDAAPWSGSPLHAAPIPLLTAVKFYGAGGQAPTSRPNFTYGDPAIWTGGPVATNPNTFPAAATNQARSPFWHPKAEHGPDFPQGSPVRNTSLYQPSAQQTPFGNRQGVWRQRSYADDDPWSWGWFLPINLNPVPTEFVSNARVRWNFDDRPPTWDRQSNPNTLLFPPTPPSTVQARAPFWHPKAEHGPDYPQGSPVRNTSLYPPSAAVSRLFYLNPPIGWSSEDAVWQHRPVRSNTISLLTVGGIIKAKLWRWDFDVGEAFWQGAPIGYVTNLPPAGKPNCFPAFPFWALGNYDIDAPGWVGKPLNAANTVNPIPPPIITKSAQMIMRQGRASHSIRR